MLKRKTLRLIPFIAMLPCLFWIAIASAMGPAKEFLTEKEISSLREAQRIDLRVSVYLKAAELRLQVAEDRLAYKESEPGDPLEFFAPEDMLNGYDKIINSIMTNLDEAFQKKKRDLEKIRRALKELKDSTKKAAPRLEIIKKIAEERKREELWNNVNQAIEINKEANDGAEEALTKTLPNKGARSQEPEDRRK